VLLHAEAGGYARRLDGQPYDAGVHTGGLLAAPDRASWEALKQALFAA
jgi:fructose-1,6-bisphosphatase/inositol monophosphatase family enzyme